MISLEKVFQKLAGLHTILSQKYSEVFPVKLLEQEIQIRLGQEARSVN